MKKEWEIRRELKTLYEFVAIQHCDSKEYWESSNGKILATKINVLEWVLRTDKTIQANTK